MTHRRVKVLCSNGFNETSFHDRDAAQRWIDNFKEAQRKHPDICQGEHTIADEEASSGPADGSGNGA